MLAVGFSWMRYKPVYRKASQSPSRFLPPSDERREQPYEYSPVSDDDEDVDVEEEVPNMEMQECYDNER